MNRVQLAIFPALLVSVLFILTATRMIARPHFVQAENSGKGGGVPEVVPSFETTGVPVVNPVFSGAKADPAQKGLLAPGSGSNYSGCTLSGNYPSSVLQWCDLIDKYARQHGLEPGLVAALITQESGGNANAYSSSGAVGLMQVMPSDGLAASFMCVSGPCFSDRPTAQELQQPEYNIAYGTKMLAELVQKYGNVREALKNYGPLDVGYYYADLVLGIFGNHS